MSLKRCQNQSGRQKTERGQGRQKKMNEWEKAKGRKEWSKKEIERGEWGRGEKEWRKTHKGKRGGGGGERRGRGWKNRTHQEKEGTGETGRKQAQWKGGGRAGRWSEKERQIGRKSEGVNTHDNGLCAPGDVELLEAPLRLSCDTGHRKINWNRHWSQNKNTGGWNLPIQRWDKCRLCRKLHIQLVTQSDSGYCRNIILRTYWSYCYH